MRKALAAVIIAAVFAFVSYHAAVSQTGAAPKPVSQVLLDNEYVHVILSTYPPGARSAMTKSPNILVYVIDGPENQTQTYADGHSTKTSFPTGAVHFSPADQDNYRTNVGSNTFRTLVVVLKK